MVPFWSGLCGKAACVFGQPVIGGLARRHRSYEAARLCCIRDAVFRDLDSACAHAFTRLQRAAAHDLASLSDGCLPMMRAVKDENESALRLAGLARRRTPRTTRSCSGVSEAGGRSTSPADLATPAA
jgi:hypothetical protein